MNKCCKNCNDYSCFIFNRYPNEPYPQYVMPTEYVAHCCGEPCYHALPQYNGFGVISKKFINDLSWHMLHELKDRVNPICGCQLESDINSIFYDEDYKECPCMNPCRGCNKCPYHCCDKQCCGKCCNNCCDKCCNTPCCNQNDNQNTIDIEELKAQIYDEVKKQLQEEVNTKMLTVPLSEDRYTQIKEGRIIVADIDDENTVVTHKGMVINTEGNGGDWYTTTVGADVTVNGPDKTHKLSEKADKQYIDEMIAGIIEQYHSNGQGGSNDGGSNV